MRIVEMNLALQMGLYKSYNIPILTYKSYLITYVKYECNCNVNIVSYYTLHVIYHFTIGNY